MVENCDECDDKHVVPGTCSFNEEPAVRPVGRESEIKTRVNRFDYQV